MALKQLDCIGCTEAQRKADLEPGEIYSVPEAVSFQFVDGSTDEPVDFLYAEDLELIGAQLIFRDYFGHAAYRAPYRRQQLPKVEE
jgi:hypothetical protein